MHGAPAEIFLELENLQLIGSFQLRGASDAMLLHELEQLSMFAQLQNAYSPRAVAREVDDVEVDLEEGSV